MNLKSFLPKRKVLSIDLGSYETKVVEGKDTKKGINVYNYFSIPTPKDAYINGEILDKELLTYTLSQEFKKRKVKTKNVHLTINSSSIITREVIIPKVEEEEIESILKFQIEEYIPMDSEDYIIQFKTIGPIYEENIEKLNILLIAIPKKIVESHFQLIKDLDLNPQVLDYQSNSIAKLINYNSYVNGTYPIENLTFAAIDIGYDSSKIAIIKNDTIMVSRIVDLGTKHMDQNILNFFEYNLEVLEEKKLEIRNINHIDDEHDDYNRLVKLVRNSIENLNDKIEIIFRYYLTRDIDNKIDMILLYGGGTGIKGISNFFTNSFNIPSLTIQSFDNIKFNGEIHKYINSIGAIIRNTEV